MSRKGTKPSVKLRAALERVAQLEALVEQKGRDLLAMHSYAATASVERGAAAAREEALRTLLEDTLADAGNFDDVQDFAEHLARAVGDVEVSDAALKLLEELHAGRAALADTEARGGRRDG